MTDLSLGRHATIPSPPNHNQDINLQAVLGAEIIIEQLHKEIILPGAMPSILVGLRFSLGLVWVLLIVAETISAQAGIGYMTMNAREFLQTDIVLVGILLYALLGKLADVLAVTLEKYLLRWHAGYQK